MMNSISDIINNKANDLFENEEEILDLEKTDDEPKNTTAETPEETFDLIKNDNKTEDLKPSALSFESANQLKSMIHTMKDQLDAMLRALNNEQFQSSTGQPLTRAMNNITLKTGEQIIEGVFNGEKMVGPDGQIYDVPPNYASKSKLVEGDLMKLTITNNGRFVYKQIAPIERKRLVGELISDPENDQWNVLCEGKTYKVLKASVTFYKGKAGDEVVFFVPENGASSWGAVENIIRKDA